MRAMSSVVVARVVGSTAAGAEVFPGTKRAREGAFPGRKKWVLVTAVALCPPRCLRRPDPRLPSPQR
jgi:hypothetical protein